jgi:hypothetical protein
MVGEEPRPFMSVSSPALFDLPRDRHVRCLRQVQERKKITHQRIMKKLVLTSAFAVLLAAVGGCSRSAAPVAEGVICFASYQHPDGKTHGFTRLNVSKAVPGGNGSWNIDARGTLTRDFLIVTRPQRPDFGPLVIPVHRLIEVQFGDGGIKTVDENHPAP